MARERKLEAPVTLFAAIEADQHEALRRIAFSKRKSLAGVVREALTEYIKKDITAKRSSRTREVAAG
ncbi:MAG: hypothetical protein HYU64_05520 [Armatimonadetes bacterium]|nr:hypothetical protein [Armatimonadota bacterium]